MNTDTPRGREFIGYKMKLKNRRVHVGHTPGEDSIVFIWQRLHRGRPKETVVRLTQEAAEATLALLVEVLRERPSVGVVGLQGQPQALAAVKGGKP